MQLFSAGPTQTPDQILSLLASPTLHHRSKEFEEIFESCVTNMKKLLGLPHIFFLLSSGSGGMESALSSLAPSSVLVLENGKFAQRWSQIAHNLRIQTHSITKEWNQAHSPQEVLDYLRSYPHIECVCFQSVESSGGVKQPYALIAQEIKAYNPQILIILDGIASIGAESLNLTHIDACIGATQKALMLPTGLAFVGISNPALKLIQTRSPLSFYLALQNYLHSPIAFSLPSSLFVALSWVFEHLDFEINYQVVAKRAKQTRDLLNHYKIPIYSTSPADSIIAFCDPHNQIKNILAQDKQILISSGQSHLKTQISRIGNFGILQDYDYFLKSLEEVLISLQDKNLQNTLS
ncbi:pyridoxal-phosphate-dependent aminotransferase family protein [Helicobacter pametensis]|uniref:pyridoxal-phosphate-dependent aminotransferase family protein n=1 Tax=Helicobacter pametensis TaxID=95149 RepID=UPI00047F7B6D|nr:aminotransferase class V-fold PLP-dependent enzyme [Helicobacter pametensis]